MRPLSLYTIATFLIGVSLGGGLGYVLSNDTIIVKKAAPETPAMLSSVNLMVVSPEGVKTWNTVEWAEAMTPLSLLEKVAAVGEITIKKGTKGDGSTSIAAINDVTADKTNSWRYFVGNTEPPRAPDKYSLKPGDNVVWVFSPAGP